TTFVTTSSTSTAAAIAESSRTLGAGGGAASAALLGPASWLSSLTRPSSPTVGRLPTGLPPGEPPVLVDGPDPLLRGLAHPGRGDDEQLVVLPEPGVLGGGEALAAAHHEADHGPPRQPQLPQVHPAQPR